IASACEKSFRANALRPRLSYNTPRSYKSCARSSSVKARLARICSMRARITSCCKVGCNGTARTSLLRQAELLHPASVKAVATKHQRKKGFISHSRRQLLDERPVPRRLNKASCLITALRDAEGKWQPYSPCCSAAGASGAAAG